MRKYAIEVFEQRLMLSQLAYAQPPATYQTNADPVAVATADLNGDGKKDLVVADSEGGNAVSVLLNSGNGTFLSAVRYACGSAPSSLVLGDFNGDGSVDIAVANEYSNSVSVLLNKGNGTFAKQVTYAVGADPIAIAAADVNADGQFDLVVGNAGNTTGKGSFTILLGRGDGTFASQVTYPVNFDVSAMTVGDFNGDGKPDLAVTDAIEGDFAVFMNIGAGAFGSETDYFNLAYQGDTFYQADAIASVDVNGDGKVDLIIGSVSDGENATGYVSVLLNNGHGLFNYMSGDAAYPDGEAGSGALVVVDLNGDGKPDIATADAGEVSALLGNGNGTFTSPQLFSTTAQVTTGGPWGLAAGDFNGDGVVDLAATNWWDVNVAVFLNGTGAGLPHITGSFTAGIPQRIVTSGQITSTLTLTNDGTANASGAETITYSLSPDGSLTDAATLGTVSDTLNLAPQANSAETDMIQLPSAAHPGMYYLIAQLSGTGSTSQVTSSQIQIMPKVVTVITPGFLTGPDAPNGENLTDFWNLENQMETLIQSGSALDGGNAYFEVDPWKSTIGFLEGLLALVAEQASNGPLMRAYFSNLLSLDAKEADYNAVDAAAAEFGHLEQDELVDPADRAQSGPNQQIIDLVGHSRGANMNAILALDLTSDGYPIDSFVSLDGFSNDWPAPANSLSNVSISYIVASLRSSGMLNSAYNYGVQAGIFDTGGAFAKIVSEATGIQLSTSALSGLAAAYPSEKAPYNGTAFTSNAVILGLGDGSANSISNHLNVTDLYASGPLLQTNSDGSGTYLYTQGGDSSVSASVEHANGTDTIEGAGSAKVTANETDTDATAESGTDTDFVDGDFSAVGSLLRQSFAGVSSDSSEQALLDLFNDPSFLLSSLWDVQGRAELIEDGSNTGAQLTQSSSIGQVITPTGSSELVQFNLSNISANSGDELEVLFNGQLLGGVNLQGAVAGSYSVPLFGMGTVPGEVDFELAGPGNDGATVTLENLSVVDDTPGTPTVAVNPVNIVYGTTLDDSQLGGTATVTENGSPVTVAGTFTYTTAVGAFLNAGNAQVEGVTFTPEDRTDCNTVTSTVTVNVAQASTSTTLTPRSLNPSNAGQSLGFTVTVAGGIPDGSTVTIQDASNNNAVVSTGTTAGGTATLTIPAGTILGGTHNLFASYAGSANFSPSQSPIYPQVVDVAVTAVVINGNLPALSGAQRSMVDSLVYTFSEAVNLAATGTDTNPAFAIAVHTGQQGTAPGLAWAPINPDANGASTQWMVTFTGTSVIGNSIANGVYDITLNASAVAGEAHPTATITPRSTDTFYRLYGDSNGDQVVNATDNLHFKNAIAGYDPIFDYDNNGAVNATDNLHFKASISFVFNTSFTTTI